MQSSHPKGPMPAIAPHALDPQSRATRFGGLLCRRSCLVPTFRGWIAVILFLTLLGVVTVRELHPFLAVSHPIHDGILVVEGWVPDYALEVAVETYKRDHYDKIYVTGGPLETGTYLSAYQTYAQLGAATLMKLGLNSNVVQAIPAPWVRQDRTFTAAVALKKWLSEHGIASQRIHLLTEGPHTRRSRLLYQKAMGKDVFIGTTAIPLREYDPKHWWHYSGGVRVVIGESLAYLYARFLFFPGPTDKPGASGEG